MNDNYQLIDKLPKAELHLHIEGTLEPELMLKLAKRNNMPLKYKSVEEIKSVYRFENLQSFLDIYYEGMKTLKKEEDFYDLAIAYFRRARENNIVNAEIFFDPQAHIHRGVKLDTVMEGILTAMGDAKKMGVESSLIISFLRHLPEADAIKTWEEASPYIDRFVAAGLDSSELGNPPSKFVRVFEKVRDSGLKVVAHAGEEGPPEYIWEAINILKVDRIDHGVRAIEDHKLMDYLAERRIPLTMCPLSNLKLRVVNDLGEYPLREFLNRGILATINSDDPAYFGGYVNENYRAVQRALNLAPRDLCTLARNSISASFVSSERKESIFRNIDKICDMHIKEK